MAVMVLSTHEVGRLHVLKIKGSLELAPLKERNGLRIFLFRTNETEENLIRLLQQFEIDSQKLFN